MPSLSLLQSHIRTCVLIIWFALLTLVVTHQLMPICSFTTLGVAVLYSLPLLIPLAGLLRGNRYTYSWATLCVLPYFIVGVTEAVANPAIHTWAIALLGFSLLWFFALVSFLRVTRQ